MAKSKASFDKRQREQKRLKQKQEKHEKIQQRRTENNKKEKTLEDMLAYVDENGNLVSVPPDNSQKGN